jgi:hypothetical protein
LNHRPVLRDGRKGKWVIRDGRKGSHLQNVNSPPKKMMPTPLPPPLPPMACVDETQKACVWCPLFENTNEPFASYQYQSQHKKSFIFRRRHMVCVGFGRRGKWFGRRQTSFAFTSLSQSLYFGFCFLNWNECLTRQWGARERERRKIGECAVSSFKFKTEKTWTGWRRRKETPSDTLMERKKKAEGGEKRLRAEKGGGNVLVSNDWNCCYHKRSYLYPYLYPYHKRSYLSTPLP